MNELVNFFAERIQYQKETCKVFTSQYKLRYYSLVGGSSIAVGQGKDIADKVLEDFGEDHAPFVLSLLASFTLSRILTRYVNVAYSSRLLCHDRDAYNMLHLVT